jgi:type I restriction enzyme S subunit
VPVPSAAEQRRITAAIEEQLSRLDNAGRLIESGLRRLPLIRRAVLGEVMPGPLPAGWKLLTVEEAGTVDLGRQRSPKYHSGPNMKPYLRVANVKAGWLELDEIKEVPISPGDVPHYALKPGDLLLTEGGDLDKLGRGALWAGDIEPCLFQNHIFAVRPRRDAVVPAFLSWATRSSAARSYFEATASRITNIASTNRSKLGRWPVPDAPVEEQRRRVAVAESAWQRAQHAITAARNLSEALTAYRSSLIHEAVTGKLDVTAASDRQMDERLHAAAENRLNEVTV